MAAAGAELAVEAVLEEPVVAVLELGVEAAPEGAVLDVEGAALPLLEADDEALEPLPLGGSTDTPPDELALEPAVLPLAAVPLEALLLGLVAVLDEVLDGLVAVAPFEPEEVVDDVVEDVVDDVEGAAVGGTELCVCAGGVLVRVPCPTGKNEPPVMSVAMMPAITATRAIPISRSGQLRRNQSMIPF